ncbi:response regulator [Longitalea luteola]|uniref:response regulator n=1 Tax=Longitalea luteola TaxID=2812563 RepID=UPI001A965B5B|nr:response regulator [Longitalea luteola]
MQNEAVLIIDHDEDDWMMITEVWKELQLNNELIFISSAEDAIVRIQKMPSAPFIIICELNLPRINGFELREKMLQTNSKKLRSVPFIFWSTTASEEQILHAYNLSVHGFFIKDNSMDELKETFKSMINYWKRSKMPPKVNVK